MNKEENERDRSLESETSSPSRKTDALIGDEEQNGQQKEEREKGAESGSPVQIPWTI